MATRVVQWATGNVGKILLQEVIQNPNYELVGVFTYNPDKVGKDAGEIVGLPPIGIRLTSDRAAIMALNADLVLHAAAKADSFKQNTEDLIALLGSGKSVITTTSYVHLGILDKEGVLAGDAERRIKEACAKRGVRFHGTGEHPGFVFERLAVTMTAASQRVDSITFRQYVDCERVPVKHMLVDLMGMGKQPEEISVKSPAFRAVSSQSEQAIVAAADVMGLRIDEIRHDVKTGILDCDLVLPAATLPAGTVVGQIMTWNAYHDGRPVLTCEEYWTCTRDIPQWNLDIKGHVVTMDVKGIPNMSIELHIDTHPVPEFNNASGGHLVVAMTAIRAIPTVLASPPGIVIPTVWGAYRFDA